MLPQHYFGGIMYNLRAVCTPAHFDQLLKAVPAAKLSEIKAALATPVISELGKEIAHKINTVKKGDHPYEHSIFQEKKVSVGLLSALRENLIGLHQYITAQNYHFHRGQTGIPPTFISLSDKFAQALITRTTTDSAAQHSALFAEMANAAPSEQGCFIYPPLAKQNITQIFHTLGLNALMQDPQATYCLLPTHSLVDAYTQIKYNGKQVDWIACLGTPDKSDYAKWQWDGKRPIKIPFEGLYSDQINGVTYRGDELYKNEIVQYWNASFCGKRMMQCSMKMAEYIGEFAKKCKPEHASQLKEMEYKMLVDIFRPEYLQHALLYKGNETGAELFWQAWNCTLIPFLANNKMLASELYWNGFYRELAGKLFVDPEWEMLFEDIEALARACTRLIKLRENSDLKKGSSLLKDEYKLLDEERHPLALMDDAVTYVLSW